MSRDMNRRDVVRVGGVLGLATLSGCMAIINPDDAQGDKLQGPFSMPSGDWEEDDALYAKDDPDITTYPEDLSSAERKILGSRDMRLHFNRELLHPYRQRNDRMGAYLDAMGMTSVARAHSRDMYKHEYVGIDGPDGTPPSPSMYDGLQTHAKSVNRLVHTYSTTVVNADGSTADVTSEMVAEEIMQELVNDPEKNEALLQKKVDGTLGVGIGFYLANHEEPDGSIVVDVYLTVDFAQGFTHDRYTK